MTTSGKSMKLSVSIPDSSDFWLPNRGMRKAKPNRPKTILGVLQRPLVATSTAWVNRPRSAYSVRKIAAPTPSGTAKRTAPTTSQNVPTIAGSTPWKSFNSATPFITKGT
jgi:hypothetical protein